MKTYIIMHKSVLLHHATVISWDIYDAANSEYNLHNQIAIPANWMEYYLAENEVGNEPLYLKITPLWECNQIETYPELQTQQFEHVIFSGADILPAGNGSNVCVIPLWAMNKLGLNPFDEVIVDKVYYLEKIAYLKVKASTKQYAEWDGLREILEAYLSTIYCISVGDLLYIGGIEFYVTQLMDVNRNLLQEGSLFETDVKIDFEVPIDLEQEEHSAALEASATQQSVNDEAERIKNSRPTREQLAELYEKKMRESRK